MEAQGDECLLFVVLDEDVCLKKDAQEFFIRCKVVSQVVDVKDNSFVFFPDSEKLMMKGLFAANSIVSSENGFIPVKLLKPDFERVVLYKGTRVGFVHELNSPSGYVENVRLLGVDEKQKCAEAPLEFPNLSHLTAEEARKLKETLDEFADVFSLSKMDIGCTGIVEHKIETGDALPIATPPRRVPMALEEKVDKMVEDLLKSDIIQPSESPWNAPIVIVAKKNGDIRMCVDYRRLNSVTKRPVYPIPATQQLLDCLSGAQYFSTLDLSQGYHQIPMAKEDMEKTAFATRRGHFEYKRMPFGLSTAPATFQKLMHMVFRSENWEQCLIYLDDILIFGRSAEEHLQRLRTVLQRVREAGLKLSPMKCSFLRREVEYLGHIIGSEGIKTDPTKVDKVKNWKTPESVKELKSFTGFCGYYRKFIKDYASLVRPLDALAASTMESTQNKKRYSAVLRWEKEHEEAFVALKMALISAPVLKHPNDSDKFVLDTDASHGGIGAVLSQIQNGVETVIAYASRALSKAERMYCVTRKELLAVHYFVKYFRHYLFGRSFTVRTDHRALQWMLNWRKPNTSQYCLWKADLEMYDMEVIHRPGVKHANADALSRLPECQQCDLKHEDPKRRRHVKIQNDTSSTFTEAATVENSATEMVIQMREQKNESQCQHWDLELDPELGVIMKLLKSGKVNEGKIPREILTAGSRVKSLWRQRHDLRIRGDMLFLVKDNKYRMVAPRKERKLLLQMVHSQAGHAGLQKTLYALQEDYYWPKMEEDANLHVASCESCQRSKGKYARNKAPYQPSLTGEPFERIAIDISGPFNPTRKGHRYILAVIDYFSKFPMLIPLKATDAKSVAKKLISHWISMFGAPFVIHSDRGTNFESELFRELCYVFGIKKTRTSPYYPQADVLVERLFRTVKPMIAATIKDSRNRTDWEDALPIVEMGLRCSFQSTTGISPFEVIYGKRMRLPVCWQFPSSTKLPSKNLRTKCEYINELSNKLEEIRTTVVLHMNRNIQRQTDYYNSNCTAKPLKLGDQVWAKRVIQSGGGDFAADKYDGPFKVVKVRNEWSYELQNMANGKRIDRNFNQLKRCIASEDKSKYGKSRTVSRMTSIASRRRSSGSEQPLPAASQVVSSSVKNSTTIRELPKSSSSQVVSSSAAPTRAGPRLVDEHHPRYPPREKTRPSRYGFSPC